MNNMVMGAFPRSGTTWARLIIEWFAERPTYLYKFGKGGETLRSLIKDDKYIASLDWKVSSPNPILSKIWKTDHDIDPNCRYIFFLRDFKEAIARHAATNEKFTHEQLLDWYTKLLENYHNHHGPKIIIHYEDLITDHESTIRRIVEFLELPFGTPYLEHKYEKFFTNYQSFREAGLHAYPDSMTKGRTVKFHSKDLTDEFINRCESTLINAGLGQYVQRYLKS